MAACSCSTTRRWSGRDIRAHLKLDDTIFTLKLTPNLAHCLSVYGIAREVSALTGAPLKQPAFPPVPLGPRATCCRSRSRRPTCAAASRAASCATSTRARSTPAWMVERLARCGQRSVTALVDISNYVMFEFGRPSHIFDLDKIHRRPDGALGRAPASR